MRVVCLSNKQLYGHRMVNAKRPLRRRNVTFGAEHEVAKASMWSSKREA